MYMLAENLYMDFAGSFMTAKTTIDMPSFGASAGDSLPGTVEEQYNVGLSYDYAMGSRSAYTRLDYFIMEIAMLHLVNLKIKCHQHMRNLILIGGLN